MLQQSTLECIQNVHVPTCPKRRWMLLLVQDTAFVAGNCQGPPVRGGTAGHRQGKIPSRGGEGGWVPQGCSFPCCDKSKQRDDIKFWHRSAIL